MEKKNLIPKKLMKEIISIHNRNINMKFPSYDFLRKEEEILLKNCDLDLIDEIKLENLDIFDDSTNLEKIKKGKYNFATSCDLLYHQHPNYFFFGNLLLL